MSAIKRVLVTVSGAALTGTVLVGPAAAAEDKGLTAPARSTAATAGACTGAFEGNPLLGPETNTLPKAEEKPVGPLLVGYQRTGKLSSADFLKKYEEPGKGWKYPPNDGFATKGGKIDKNETTLKAGQLLDRFGGEGGTFLAPAGAKYGARALPPNNLNTQDPKSPCNYHTYKVLKPFKVWQGGIAPWFEQAGGGQQILLDPKLQPVGPGERLSVAWLVEKKFLARA
ncbi:TNT domain-containing protein [Streptomyces gamaensis]|uniref:TNT domain-containing protein n=1 Tax=Streptomyces gamaensis TaxID=1763542 RepID=A0ABW0YXH1_9ACTN